MYAVSIKDLLSYYLKQALDSNPYKIVNDAIDTVNENRKTLAIINDYVWYKWREQYCDLTTIDVS